MTTSWTIIMWATDNDAEYERYTSNDYHEVYEMCKVYTRIHQVNGRFKERAIAGFNGLREKLFLPTYRSLTTQSYYSDNTVSFNTIQWR